MAGRPIAGQCADDPAAVTPEGIAEARREVGLSLSRCRAAAGLTQADLAAVVCWSRSTVANVERGRQNVPAAFWQRADAAVSADGVLAGEAARVASLVHRYAVQVETDRIRQRLSAAPPVVGAGMCCCGDSTVRVPIGVGWPVDVPRSSGALAPSLAGARSTADLRHGNLRMPQDTTWTH